MNNVHRNNTRKIALSGVMLSLILALQAAALPQIFTGIMVNAVFIVLYNLAGLNAALSVSLLTPIGGALTGVLPAPLMPLIPAIIAGNLIYIVIYHYLKDIRFLVALPAAAIGKGTAIFVIGSAIIAMIDAGEGLTGIFRFFSAVQFGTAFAGAVIGHVTGTKMEGWKSPI